MPKNRSFRRGYSNCPSRLVEDPNRGIDITEEILKARENSFQDSDYVLRDFEALGDSLPFIREFQKGKHKDLSDKYYIMAAPRVKNTLCETEISVE